MKKVLLKDLVIPQGTVFNEAPIITERVGGGHFEATFGLSKDSFGSIEYAFDEPDNELNEWFTDLK